MRLAVMLHENAPPKWGLLPLGTYCAARRRTDPLTLKATQQFIAPRAEPVSP